MDANEVVVHEVQRHGVRVVLDLLAECVRQSREPAHMHPHGEVLAFDVGRARVLPDWPSNDRTLVRPDALGRAVVPIFKCVQPTRRYRPQFIIF